MKASKGSQPRPLELGGQARVRVEGARCRCGREGRMAEGQRLDEAM